MIGFAPCGECRVNTQMCYLPKEREGHRGGYLRCVGLCVELEVVLGWVPLV